MNIFIVDAGCIIASAFCENSVSPRVSDTMIAPHSPVRVWLANALLTALASAVAPTGRLHEVLPAEARLVCFADFFFVGLLGEGSLGSRESTRYATTESLAGTCVEASDGATSGADIAMRKTVRRPCCRAARNACRVMPTKRATLVPNRMMRRILSGLASDLEEDPLAVEHVQNAIP